jgi:hypothetical protein
MGFKNNIFLGNCRGVLNVVTITLLLGVAVTGFLFFNNWYSNFLPEIQNENLGSYSFTEEYVEFLRVDNNSGVYSLVVRNKVADNFNVTSINVNGVLCSMGSDSLIYRNSITSINLSCSNFEAVSSVMVMTEFGVILSNVLVE